MENARVRMRRRIDVLKQELDELRRAGAAQGLLCRSGRDEAAAQMQLARIDAALSRMARGSYGYCANCGSPVGVERLKTDPTASHCSKCG